MQRHKSSVRLVNKRNLQAAKKRKLLSAKSQQTPKNLSLSLLKKTFRYGWRFYTFIALLLTAIFYVFELPSRIVEFTENYPKANAYGDEIAYSPENWMGIFDTFPEGIVNYNDLGISSPVEAALEIDVYDGNKLDGRIWWQLSCNLGLPYTGILIEGEIELGGTIANVEVYDFKDGKRISFFKGRLHSDGLIVEFSGFPSSTALNGSRIAKNPSPAMLEEWEDLYCD